MSIARTQLVTPLLCGLIALASPEGTKAQGARRSSEAALVVGIWVGGDIAQLGSYSGPGTTPTTFVTSTFSASYSEGNDALIGIRYTHSFNSWLAAEGTAVLTSPLWTVRSAGFSDTSSVALGMPAGRTALFDVQSTGSAASSGFAEVHRVRVNTRTFSVRVLVSMPAQHTGLSAFVAAGIAALWYEPTTLLSVLGPGGARLSALSLGTRFAPNMGVGLRVNISQALGLRVEGDMWLPQLREGIAGDRFTVRNLSIQTSIGVLF